MTEQELLNMGAYCQRLLLEEEFNALVKVIEASLAQRVLASTKIEDREEAHKEYTGLVALLETMQQFVIEKDQIVERQEQEQKEEKDE